MIKNILKHRWIDIILLSLISVAIIEILCKSHWLMRNFYSWADISTSLPWYLQFIIGIFGFYCIYKLLLDFKIFHLDHLNNPSLQIKYPPIYFAAILAILILLFIENFQIQLPTHTNIFGLIAIWIGIAEILNQHEKSITPKEIVNSGPSILFESNNNKFLIYLKNKNRDDLIEFHTWLHKEEPIEIDESDAFDRYIYVERISNILVSDRNTPCQLALIGEFGSGKSSVTKTVLNKIRDKNNSFIFVHVDGWGRSEKSCAAQILEEIVESLSKHIDCSSIKNIPKNYLDALAGSNISGSKFIVSLMQKYQAPIDFLGKIQRILSTIDRRLLIVLEDFDRQSNSDEEISEVAALLDRLKKYNRINFIISIGYLTDTEVISKICTRREDLGSIQSERKIEQIFELMNEYEAYKHPLNLKRDKSLIPQLAKDIAPIIKTPRDLKHALRRSFSIWENLAGEVDIYDLLKLNIIRFIKPRAFDHICTHINELKKLATDQEFAKLRTGTIQFLENPTGSENPFNFDPINEFILQMFPNANELRKIEQRVLLNNQRIAYLGETDFFNRVLRENTDEKSDVLALKKIKLLANAESAEAKTVILEISKSTFLIEKFLQYYGCEDSENKIKIIDPNNTFNLLMAITSKENFNLHKNLEEYFETFHMRELIRILTELKNTSHVMKILKRVCEYNLGTFLNLTTRIDPKDLDMAYEVVILDVLNNPRALQASLGKYRRKSLLDFLTDILLYRHIRLTYIEKFMSLILETLIEFPQIKPFVDDLFFGQFPTVDPVKLALYQEKVDQLKAHVK